jgi:acetylornithine deacetylase/succinyl-diaminopimelate desuccinylase-like protein
MSLSRILSQLELNAEARLERLKAFLKIPSISADPAYFPACEEAARWCEKTLQDIGFEARLVETSGRPVVVAHRPKARSPHVLFYGHYDVQPVVPLELWHGDPFEGEIIELKQGRQAIRARGAADDKGQVLTFIEACRATLEVSGELPIGVTIVLEGEEECGSPSLPEFFAQTRDELKKADVVLVCDTEMWNRETPAITTSLRGLVYEEVTITCANRDLHSGLYGGPALNPIRVLTNILGQLHDENGAVALEGFYEGIKEPPQSVKATWDALAFDEATFLGDVELKHRAGEKDRSALEQLWSRPACDINGIEGGYTGAGAKTVLPSSAKAKVSFRLVAGQDPKQVQASFRRFVQERLPKDAKATCESFGTSGAIAVSYDNPFLSKAAEALSEEWGRPAALIGSGASIPIVGSFQRELGRDSLLIGFGLPDDAIHAPNEKYDLSSFDKGARSWARILHAFA